jgi:hypothetical protein
LKLINKYTALFFVFLIFAYITSSVALKGLSYNAVASTAVKSQKWAPACHKRPAKKPADSNKRHSLFFKSFSSAGQSSVTIIPCHSSLQILPASNLVSLKPDRNSKPVCLHTSHLSTQTFVFREPDPPRFIS